MGYRILADENVEQATVNYLQKPGHDVECLDTVSELGLGADDASIFCPVIPLSAVEQRIA
jgi:hypothetical protein